jgi:hypothetical protein
MLNSKSLHLNDHFQVAQEKGLLDVDNEAP